MFPKLRQGISLPLVVLWKCTHCGTHNILCLHVVPSSPCSWCLSGPPSTACKLYFGTHDPREFLVIRELDDSAACACLTGIEQQTPERCPIATHTFLCIVQICAFLHHHCHHHRHRLSGIVTIIAIAFPLFNFLQHLHSSFVFCVRCVLPLCLFRISRTLALLVFILLLFVHCADLCLPPSSLPSSSPSPFWYRHHHRHRFCILLFFQFYYISISISVHSKFVFDCICLSIPAFPDHAAKRVPPPADPEPKSLSQSTAK